MRCKLNLRSGPPCITCRSSRNAVDAREKAESGDSGCGKLEACKGQAKREDRGKHGSASDRCTDVALGTSGGKISRVEVTDCSDESRKAIGE